MDKEDRHDFTATIKEMRFFRITVGDRVFVKSGDYPMPVFDMSRVFVKSFGYDRCRIYDDRNALIASFKFDSLPPNGHLSLRSYMKSGSDSKLKRLVFVLSPQRANWKILLGSIFRKDRVVTFRPRKYVNCTAEKI